MKPAVGTVVTAIRDIERADDIVIAKGTELVVTDTMERKGYAKPDRVGVRVPGTKGLSIGVVLGQDVAL